MGLFDFFFDSFMFLMIISDGLEESIRQSSAAVCVLSLRKIDEKSWCIGVNSASEKIPAEKTTKF